MDPNISISVTSLLPATPRKSPLLPLEILVEIFLLSLPPTNLAQAPQKTALALVCRYWNSIIESTPILWSQISIADTESYVQKSLLKSGNLSIDVNGARLGGDGRLAAWCDGICCGFMEDIMLHSDRWRHAALQLYCEYGRCGRIELETPLISLRSLKLYADNVGPIFDQYLELLKKENTPHLREVSLNDIELTSWDISFPPSLSKLTIQNISEHGPSLTKVLSFLIACPNLTLIHFCNMVIEEDGTEDRANTLTVVELAVLQELKLNWIPCKVVQSLFRRLRFPEECTISFSCAIDDASPSTSFLAPTLSRYYRSLDSAEEIDTVTFVLDEDQLRLDVVCRRRWHIGLGLCGARAIRDSLKWFGIITEEGNAASHLENSSTYFTKPSKTPISLTFEPDLSVGKDLNLLASISKLKCITRVEVSGSIEERRRLLWYLSGHAYLGQPVTNLQNTTFPEPGAKSHTVEVHPFPGLGELVVRGMEVEVLKDVVSMVRSRSGSSAKAGASGKLASLKRIEFVDENDAGTQDESCHMVLHGSEDVRHHLLCNLLLLLKKDTEVFWGGKRLSLALVLE